ncbi:hypothetical protein FXO38_10733 [Capsicum annuum]|nr:hypothetical protein FXO38_10733 [Capsicum annuum]
MVSGPIMLVDIPVIPRRLRKPAAVCESPFLSKFYSGCGKVEGQSSKCVENAQSRKNVLSIKHPFVKSITERINDMKVTLKFNRFVARSLRVKQMPFYSDSVNALQKHFYYGVDIVKMKEWFFTLAYLGVPLTDLTLYKRFVENNRDVTLITQEHQIVEYMLGFFMRCNVPWNSVDNVLFPINLAEEFHCILTRLSFKDQCIYVYDSIHGAGHVFRVHKSVATYSELISYFLSCIEFWESRSDRLPVANSFDIRIVDGFSTQTNTDCGIFVAAFAEYLLDGLKISNHLDNIDAIHNCYAVLLCDYGKKKQIQCAVSEDESTDRLLKKKDGVQQI